MSASEPPSEGLAEVVRLSTSLAYRVLNTQLIGSPVPPDQAQALVNAAKLMHDNGVDWPPGVVEALRRLVETLPPATPEADEPADQEPAERDEDVGPTAMSRGRKIKRFIRSFRRGRD
jgi:hypothetical protein